MAFKKKIKTGILAFVLLFPVFFVCVFYLRGRLDMGLDQKINTFDENKTTPGDTVFHSVSSFVFEGCDHSNVTFESIGKISIVGFYPKQSKLYKNQLLRIIEGYKYYDDVNLVFFDSIPSLLLENLQYYHCSLSSVESLVSDNFHLPEAIRIADVVSSFVLIDEHGFVKGVYHGETKSRIDDLLMETKALLKKSEDEKG